MAKHSQAGPKRRYRSPKRALAWSFERSRDGWKAKYKVLQERNEAFRTEVRDVRCSRDKWRAKAESLQQQLDELRAEARRTIESPPALRRPSPRLATQRSS